MRIAMFSWESMHSIAIGGLAPHITELAGGLERRGHEVHVFTRMGLNQTGYDLIDGVHYHRCPFEPHDDFLTYVARMNDSFSWHFAETESFIGQPFDVVHGHDWMTVWALSQVKHRHQRPIVFTVHSTEYGRCGNSVWDDPMSRRIRDIEWEGSYIAQRVICVSKTLAEEARRLYDIPEDKVHPIYNGVNVEKYNGNVDAGAVRKFHGIGLDDPLVLFAGRLTWQKGPDLLVEAIPGVLKSHPRTKILFAGDGDMKPGLESRASQIGIDHATRFLGHCKGDGLVNLFKSSDMVCVPSRNEPFGIVILEAWSASKPVVATRIGGPTEFVRHAVNGFTVDPGVEAIGQGLELMLADMPSAQEMGRKGRIEAESRFTWDHSAADTETVYKSIFNGQAADTSAVNGKHRKENGNMTRPTTATTKRSGDTTTETTTREGTIKSMSSKSLVTTTSSIDEQIRKRAYELYLARARTGAAGDPTTDWLQAERELRTATTPAGRGGK
jgi:glycosyltransferase involved in cell wall biosynthesis